MTNDVVKTYDLMFGPPTVLAVELPRKDWEAIKLQFRGNLSLAEEGSANATQEHQQYVEWAVPQLERLGREMQENTLLASKLAALNELCQMHEETLAEATTRIEQLLDENERLKHDLEQALANHSADLSHHEPEGELLTCWIKPGVTTGDELIVDAKELLKFLPKFRVTDDAPANRVLNEGQCRNCNYMAKKVEEHQQRIHNQREEINRLQVQLSRAQLDAKDNHGNYM